MATEYQEIPSLTLYCFGHIEILVNKLLGDGYHFLKLLRGSSFWNEIPLRQKQWYLGLSQLYSCSHHKIELNSPWLCLCPVPLSATNGRNKELECLLFFFRSLTSRALWPCVLFTCQLFKCSLMMLQAVAETEQMYENFPLHRYFTSNMLPHSMLSSCLSDC